MHPYTIYVNVKDSDETAKVMAATDCAVHIIGGAPITQLRMCVMTFEHVHIQVKSPNVEIKKTKNKAQLLAACGHVSATSHSLRFILGIVTLKGQKSLPQRCEFFPFREVLVYKRNTIPFI